MDSVMVAEISFNRNASAEELRRLGEVLKACCQTQKWIAVISGLDDLLKGECPQMFSKAISNLETGEIIPFYDPILVWARLDYPDKESINPVKILSGIIPSELGSVNYPDPDGGV